MSLCESRQLKSGGGSTAALAEPGTHHECQMLARSCHITCSMSLGDRQSTKGKPYNMCKFRNTLRDDPENRVPPFFRHVIVGEPPTVDKTPATLVTTEGCPACWPGRRPVAEPPCLRRCVREVTGIRSFVTCDAPQLDSGTFRRGCGIPTALCRRRRPMVDSSCFIVPAELLA